MHDDQNKEGLAESPSSIWADRVNEAYYDSMGALFGRRTRDRINWMASKAIGHRTLDVGCSQGITSILMAREGMQVVGIDIFQGAIDYAKSEMGKEIQSVRDRLEFRCVDVAAVSGELFDTVLLGEVVEHQTNPKKFIQQAVGLLAPNGRLVITVPFGLHPWPDHKSTVFPGDIYSVLSGDFSFETMEVIDGYIRVVADRRAATVGVDHSLALSATEVGAIEWQKKFYATDEHSRNSQKELSELKTSVARLKGDHQKEKDNAEALSKQLNALNASVLSMSSELTYARLELTKNVLAMEEGEAVRLRQHLQIQEFSQSAEAHKLTSASASGTIIELQSALHTAQADSAQVAAQLQLAQAQVLHLESTVDSLESALGEARQRVVDNERELESILSMQLARESEQEALRTQASASMSENEELQARLAILESEHVAALRSVEDARESAIAALNDTVSSREAENLVLEQKLLTQASMHEAASKEAALRFSTMADELAQLRRKSEELEKKIKVLDEHEKKAKLRLSSMHEELVVAQYKRSGHYAHLEAERERSSRLVELANNLHLDNQLYKNSIALSLGRALIGLSTVRGFIGFPRTVWSALRRYRNRGMYEMYEQLELPKLRPVALPSLDSATVVASKGISADTKRPAESVAFQQSDTDEQRRRLSVIGWDQPATEDRIPVMSVMDEFSRSCFSPQAALIEPRPDNWEGLLDAYRPRFLFVESSWKGNYGAWQYRIANYANPPGKELSEMVAGFRLKGIPTVFWNKEDPVHFSNFIGSASKFDHILTTASEVVPAYEKSTPAKVGVLQFAAEESLHNPIGSASRNGKICFAGSFYSNRFQERRDDQLMLLDAAAEFDFDIYDRNHDPLATKKSDFAFPERFEPFVKGRLPYQSIGRAYREYRVFLNVNSVIDSPTMFSRRVFELLACGTPVVSTWSRGTEETFGNDLVWHVKNAEEAREAIRVLMTDDKEWRRRSLAGIRSVFARHTFRHRFNQVLEMIDQSDGRSAAYDDVSVIAEVANQSEANAVIGSFARQEMLQDANKRLLLVSRGKCELNGVPLGTDSLDIDLVESSDEPLAALVARMKQPSQQRMLATMSPYAAYGKNHLQDLVHASRYSRMAIVGKPLDSLESSQYSYGIPLDPRAILIDEKALDGSTCSVDALIGSIGQASPIDTVDMVYGLDSANFIRTESVLDPAQQERVLRNIEL